MLFIPDSFKTSNYSFQFPGFGTSTSSKGGTNFTVTLSNGNGNGNGNSKRTNPNFMMTYNSTITPDFIFIEMTVVSKKKFPTLYS